jgi:Tfp pilus assembly protein PilF
MAELEEKLKVIKEYIKKKAFSDARIEAEKLVYIHSANAELNFLMGYIYDKLNLLSRAEEFLQNALTLDPNHYDTLVELSLFHEKNGHKEIAAIYRERSFRIANKFK